MAELFPVPEIAAGTTEVVVSEWLVRPGDSFKAGDPIVVIETDKAVVEVEAEAEATLLRALVEAGTRVGVGAPVALVGSEAEAEGDLDALLAELGVDAQDEPPPAAAGGDLRDETVGTQAPGDEPAADTPRSAGPSSDGGAGGRGRIFISPIARKLLREAGLSPEGIQGSGPNNRIRRRDVEPVIAAAAREVTSDALPEPTPDAQPAAPGRPEPLTAATEIPHSRVRAAVARRLTESKQQVPHFYLRRTAVIDQLLALRSQVNEVSPTRISVNDFLIRAMAVAHTEVPDANVVWTEEAMRRFDSVDIAVAVASERGLVTPVLRGVETSSLATIARQVKELAAQADAGRLRQSDLEGGSITISNLGMFGVDEFSAIINPPQSAILAVGAGRPTAVVEDGEVTVRTVVELVLSVDHRAIDGALAARWMAALVDAIHQPLRLVV